MQTFINEEKYHMNITFDENIWQKYKRSTLQGEIATPTEEEDNVAVLCCSFQR